MAQPDLYQKVLKQYSCSNSEVKAAFDKKNEKCESHLDNSDYKEYL
jgi:hypothetical protein